MMTTSRALLSAVVFLTQVAGHAATKTPFAGANAPVMSLVGAAFDEARSRVVIVGVSATTATAVETWEWDGAAWSKISDTGPSPRNEPLMAYDRARGQVVLHGGYRDAELMNDTWVLDGAKWRQVATDGPSPRNAAAMTYDSRRGRIVLFGGGSGPMGSPLHNDLWEWDGRRWTRIVDDGQPNSPPARALHALAYDDSRGRLVLAGGFALVNGGPTPFNDTWESYDGKSWTKLLDDGPPRGRHRLVYDRRTRTVVLYGGWGPKELMSELWRFDGRTWARVSP